jgi:hypothetical protein
MGLLFVLESDESAAGIHVDVPIGIHKTIMLAAKNQGNNHFPLVRRINRFYGDVLFEADEIDPLIEELHGIYKITSLKIVSELIKLCAEAKKHQVGVETIAD